MTSAAPSDESHDQADEVLRRTRELDPVADELRAALLGGASPESLGLAEDGLATVRKERGID